MTREEQIDKAALDYCGYDTETIYAHIENAFIAGAEWADAHPKPVEVTTEELENVAKEIWEQEPSVFYNRLWDMIERNYRAHFLREACKWLEQHLHHDNVGGFWADATSVDDFINQFKSSCSELPNNSKGGEQ